MSVQNTTGFAGFPVPIATILPFAGSPLHIPNGYLVCNGQYLIITEYQELFNVIGQTYQTIAVANQFQVPNLVATFIKSATTSGTSVPASATISNPTITNANLPSITGMAVTGTMSGTLNGDSNSVVAKQDNSSIFTDQQQRNDNVQTLGTITVTQNSPPVFTYTNTAVPIPFPAPTAPITSSPANIELVYIIRAEATF